MTDFSQIVRAQNRFMIGFDLVLGTGTLLAPDQVLRMLGHREPSDDAREAFRRCAPIWLTYAAAHALADRRGRPEDWWAVAWLRGTEIATDVLWSQRSRAFNARGRRAMVFAGVSNVAMALAYGQQASRQRAPRRAARLLRR